MAALRETRPLCRMNPAAAPIHATARTQRNRGSPPHIPRGPRARRASASIRDRLLHVELRRRQNRASHRAVRRQHGVIERQRRVRIAPRRHDLARPAGAEQRDVHLYVIDRQLRRAVSLPRPRRRTARAAADQRACCATRERRRRDVDDTGRRDRAVEGRGTACGDRTLAEVRGSVAENGSPFGFIGWPSARVTVTAKAGAAETAVKATAATSDTILRMLI